MGKRLSKGFTIIELVIVIAVIGVLSAVLIPTFANLINKASDSADKSTVRNLNTALRIDDTSHRNMHEALVAAGKNGYNVDAIKNIGSKTNGFAAWDSVKDRFVLIQKGEGGNDTFYFTLDNEEESGPVSNKHDYFVIYDEIPAKENQAYSIYLSGEEKTGTMNVYSVGFDVGNNLGISRINYTNENGAADRTIILRTNNTATELFVEDSSNNKILHFGDVGSESVSSGDDSFYEFGGVLDANVKKGHYVAKANSILANLDATAELGDVVVDLSAESIQGDVTNHNDPDLGNHNHVTIHGASGAKTVNFSGELKGANLSADFKTAPIYHKAVDSEGSISGLGDVPRIREDHTCAEHDFVKVSGLSVQVCTTCTGYAYEKTAVTVDAESRVEKTEKQYFVEKKDDGTEMVIDESPEHHHSFEETWTWSDDLASASLDLSCDSDDCQYTVSLHIPGNGTIVSDGVTAKCEEAVDETYTATINYQGSIYQDSRIVRLDPIGHDFDERGECTRCHAFNTELLFPHTDEFLYRVGNKNPVPVERLVEGTVANVSWEKVHGDVEATSCSATELRFSGVGVVKLTINNGRNLYLEVINAKNVTTYGELTNGNCVLLNDIVMSNGASFYLNGATLYGNGFVFDVAAGANKGQNASSSYVVGLNNATLDNVTIRGAVYTEYGIGVGNPFTNAAVLTSGDSVIANSCISNCASPIRAQGGTLLIENTTIRGGIFANVDIRNAAVTLKNVTTINQREGNDSAGNITPVGLGIVVYYESITQASITVEGELRQYNYISKNDSFSNSYAQAFKQEMFKHADYIYRDSSNVEWVNTGIISMTPIERVGLSLPSGLGYSQQSVSVSLLSTTYSGFVASQATAPQVPTADYAPSGQYSFRPYVTHNKAGDTYADGKLIIGFSQGDSYQWDANKISVKANEENVDVSISIEGNGASYDQATNIITFTEGGEYLVRYNYCVSSYEWVDGEAKLTNKSYETTIPVSVTATSSKASITFDGYQVTEHSIGEKTFLLTTNADTSVGKIGKVTEKVNGQDMVFGYPVIEYKGSMSSTVYWPVFGNIVRIEDEGITYGSTTKSIPDQLTCYWGRYTGTINGKAYDQSYGGTAGSDVYTSVFNCARGGQATVAKSVYDNQAVYSQGVNNSNRKDLTFLVKYCYQSGGYTFYYYIGYKAGSGSSGGSGGSCLVPNTLITMADGSSKQVKDIVGGDLVKVFNHETGTFDISTVMFNDMETKRDQTVINLKFSNGKKIGVISEHGFFDLELNQYIYIREDNYERFIGHRFYGEDGVFRLEDAYLTNETIEVFSPVTVGTLNYFTEGILSMPGGIEGLFNYFDYDADLKYDEEKMREDITKYGLLEYSYFENDIPFEVYEAFNGKYLGIAMGKGLLTPEDLARYIARYSPYWA